MSDKMRSGFEEWYRSQAVFHKSHLVPLSTGYYFGAVAETAWRAWQAARTVPEKVECGCGDIYPASQFMCANCLAAVGAADELRRVDEAQSVPVVGEPVAWVSTIECIGPEYQKKLFGRLPIQSLQAGYYSHTALYEKPTHSIPAAELASLREKAAEADELRKDAERLQYMLDEAAIIMCAVGTTSTMYRLEWPLTGYVQTDFHKSEREAIDAAIAGEK